MKRKCVKTFTATIYLGFKDISLVDETECSLFELEAELQNYKNQLDSETSISQARNICQTYCNNVGLCVTITPTEFIYTNGSEPGCAIGLINYPKFHSDPDTITKHAIRIATLLKDAYKQNGVTIVTSDETIMLCGESK